ncbi:hypothetical protein O6H91_Y437100 [Diphasiastrum complanatum]|nr:hypothetical protein O6H91_Y437100 [Diphasiastrum complanatum]KAJ7241731.1 hypothetical protein O6H91_Y437100 [Diphasiastrum complanatum]KAJ7241732.1 hypothetical protein O6H91_Y437100 [Diphasiastrum complanatum]
MAAYAGGKDRAAIEANSNLAIIVYQKYRFPFALRGWQEGCVPLKDTDPLQDVGVFARRDEGGTGRCKRQEVIDLVSDEEDKEVTEATSVLTTGWPEEGSKGARKKLTDGGSSEKFEGENAKAARKRLFMNESFSNIPDGGESWQSGSKPGKKEKLSTAENIQENSSRFDKNSTEKGAIAARVLENGGSKASSSYISKSKRNGESAGVIPLADADVLDWMAVSRKEDLADRACGKLPGERSTKRTVAVKTTHSSALAKKSDLPPPPVQWEEMKQQSFQEDLASMESKKKKPRMRGELKIRDGARPTSAPPLVINNENVSAGVAEAAGSSHVPEEVRTLLRTDGSSQEHEESEERKILRQTLQKFEVLRRKVLRDEEARVKESGNGVKRPDLKAGSIMNTSNLWLNRSKKIGAIPGVEVGDQFYFRIELCIVGLHKQIQAGIDSIPPKDNQWDVPLAASIIASGGYEDDLDTGETLIYTGQGGNNYQGNKRQQQDQKLERGNLALKHSYKIGVPVRVIRGSKCKESPSGKIYTYDGLYKVEKFWLDKGLSGFGVYKFQLQRLPGQLRTSSAIVKFMGTMKIKSDGKEPMMIHEDISGGKEELRICVVNSVDELTDLPAAFEYATSMLLPPEFEKRPPPEGCHCINECSDTAVCCCIRRTGGQLPYTGDGALVEVKNIVYECSQECQCPPTCHNRVSQHGTKYRLELFKKEGGWGVRSWDSIPSGSFICEYIGKVAASGKAMKCFKQCDYVLHLDNLKQRVAQDVDVSINLGEPAKSSVAEGVEGDNLSIDARDYGNVARFINHSCSPNLYVQFVLYDHEDLKLPHVMLFAMENIRPFTELTFDYGCGTCL